MALNRRKFLKKTALAAGVGAVPAQARSDNGHGKESDATTITIQRRIPIRHDVDVFVAGGGPSGIAAAVAAARQGRRVVVAERHNALGGMGTMGLLPLFMPFTDGVNFLAGGVGKQVQSRLKKAGGTGIDSDVVIRSEVLKRVYDEMFIEAGVEFAFETRFIDVEVRDDRVVAAILAAKSGIFGVRAGMFVDCTGDGDLAAWAGAPYKKGDEDGNMMAGTLCSLWTDIDWTRVYELRSHTKQEKLLPKAIEEGLFTYQDRHLPGMFRIGEHTGGGNIGHTFGVDGTDERSVTKAMIWARKLILEYEKYYKNYLEGFENMELVTLASMLGIRESRRIMGDYVLDLEDFKNRAVFDDEIGRYSYPVDIHASKPGDADYQEYAKDFKNLRYGKGENYGIPYRTLVPQKLSNVLVAGRSISTDRYMQGSVRVMPGCFITGQAAGVAASIAVEKRTDTRGVSIGELQDRLKKMGAFLPNC